MMASIEIMSIESASASRNCNSTVRIVANQYFISRLLKHDVDGSYLTKLSEQVESHEVTIKALTNKHVLIYDVFLVKKLCDARKIIIHKVASFTSQRRETHSIIILFEKYEKFLPGVWLITNKLDSNSYESFFKFLKIDFPQFAPAEAVVDYDENMQHGLRSAFPEIQFVVSFSHQIQEIIEKAIETNAAVEANRVLNAEKHSILKKFIALSLLPKDNIQCSYVSLVKECRANFGSYFDSFIKYYDEKWMTKWKSQMFCVHQSKDLMKIFLELYDCQKMFRTNTEYDSLMFIGKIKATLTKVRKNLDRLEHGDIIPYYFSPEDEEIESKLYTTWNRLSQNSITVKECLIICSNLLKDSFIDELIDAKMSETSNNTRNEMINEHMHNMTTEMLR